MKTFKTKLLTIAVLLCSISASAYEFNVEGICYNVLSLEDLTVEVSQGWGWSITIPESVTDGHCNYSVTSIGERAFYGCTSLEDITIPNSVTSIGSRAFEDCTDLTSVSIPNSVTSVGHDVFSGCTSLPVENNIRYAGTWAVEVLDKEQTSYTLRSNTTRLNDYLFQGCSNLTNVTIPNSVTSVGDYAFFGCTSLPVENNIRYAGTWAVEVLDKEQTSYTLRSNTTRLERALFEGCSNLTNITIPNSVTSIGDWVFGGTGLTSIDIPNSITSIGDYAFFGCTGLTSIDIPNSITSIGDCAFEYCTGLTSITIPNSVTSIGSYAFSGCSILTEENYIQYLGTWAVEISDREQTSYSLRANTTGLANYLFRNCSSLTSIIIPNSVAYKGNDIFNGCTELRTVIDFSNIWISNLAYEVINVDGQIGDFIFEKRSDNTYYLEAYIGNENNLTLPEKYKGGDYAIGGDCFYKNDCLKTLSIPNTVTRI